MSYVFMVKVIGLYVLLADTLVRMQSTLISGFSKVYDEGREGYIGEGGLKAR